MKTTFKKTIQHIKDLWNMHKFLLNKVQGKQFFYFNDYDITFNFGTIPKNQARTIIKILKKLGFKGKFRLRGHGKRTRTTYQDLPLNQAKKTAVYFTARKEA